MVIAGKMSQMTKERVDFLKTWALNFFMMLGLLILLVAAVCAIVLLGAALHSMGWWGYTLALLIGAMIASFYATKDGVNV